MQPVDRGLDDAIVGPAHQPVGGRAVEEVMLAGPFPDEVPAMLRVDADRSATPARYDAKCAACGFLPPSLPIFNRIGVVARAARHESDPEHTAVVCIAESVDLPVLVAIPRRKRRANGRTGERV